MKNKNILLLGAVGLAAAYFFSKKYKASTVGASGLSPSDYSDAVATDSNALADWILSATTTETALNRGNASLQLQQGLDLTSPAWSAAMDASPQTSTAYTPGQTVTNAWQAVAVVASLPVTLSNPFTNQAGSYPRTVEGILVTDPNMMERLRIGWDNNQRGYTH